MTTCRACSECDGHHHWLYGEGGFDPETGEPIAEYGCKHCDALGDPCIECGAEPELDDEPRNRDCPSCNGRGIVVVAMRTDNDEQ